MLACTQTIGPSPTLVHVRRATKQGHSSRSIPPLGLDTTPVMSRRCLQRSSLLSPRSAPSRRLPAHLSLKGVDDLRPCAIERFKFAVVGVVPHRNAEPLCGAVCIIWATALIMLLLLCELFLYRKGTSREPERRKNNSCFCPMHSALFFPAL